VDRRRPLGVVLYSPSYLSIFLTRPFEWSNSNKIEPHGRYTDNTGDPGYNVDLSKRRADAVAQELTHRYNVEDTRLSTVGFGASHPKAENDTPEGRAYNRRVELSRT
jgi:outer membrane protein OmpA-like peptidoglycan-associated protein